MQKQAIIKKSNRSDGSASRDVRMGGGGGEEMKCERRGRVGSKPNVHRSAWKRHWL